MKVKQPWYCEQCGARGEVAHRPHAGVFEVVDLIDEAHQKAAPHCIAPVERLRVPTTANALMAVLKAESGGD